MGQNSIAVAAVLAAADDSETERRIDNRGSAGGEARRSLCMHFPIHQEAIDPRELQPLVRG